MGPLGSKKERRLPKQGTKVRTVTKLEGPFDGWLVEEKYIKARRSGNGVYHGFAPGTGGDVWWVKHSNGEIAAYSALEEILIRRVVMAVNVEQGSVVVNSVFAVCTGDKFRVLFVDCKTKYPEIVWTSGAQVGVAASEWSVHRGKSTEHTVIDTGCPKDWEMLVEASRYSIYIVLYKHATKEEEIKLLWEASHKA